MDRGAWQATVHGGRKELDTAEVTKHQQPSSFPFVIALSHTLLLTHSYPHPADERTNQYNHSGKHVSNITQQFCV